MPGVAVSSILSTFRAGLREALDWPWLSWLKCPAAVAVSLPNGTRRVMRGARVVPGSESARFSAVVLPPEQILFRRLTLPALADAELVEALALEVANVTPFDAADTVWGWRLDRRDDAAARVTVALTSRRRVEDYLATRSNPAGELPELWADADPPLMLGDFGEQPRALAERRSRRLLATFGLLTVMLAMLVVSSPYLQLRQQVFDAQQRFEDLQRNSAAVTANREALIRMRAQGEAIAAVLAAQPDVLALLEELTVTIPDAVYLTNLDVQGTSVRITGQGPAASALVDRLGAQPRFRGLRATSAITRVGDDGTERFSVEFEFVPDRMVTAAEQTR